MSLSKKQLAIMELLPLNDEGGEDISESLQNKCNFCPKCGGTKNRHTGNMSSYPEVWEKVICSDCGFTLGLIDNSPMQWWSEWKFNNWEIDL